MNTPYIMKKGVSRLSDLIDGGSAHGYPGDYPGREYFVNNIVGLSTYYGSSWLRPFDELSTAITAAEAYRLAMAATNVYVRNRIYVQGTATAYSALTALPNYCDIIGIGADPRGNGAGIARVEGASTTDTVASTGVRGLNLFNMQFGGSGAAWAMNLAICFRSIFENVAFVNRTTGGLQIVTGGGITLRNCHVGGDTATPALGINVGTAGGNFNQSLVEDCMIYASTSGFLNHAYLSDGTLVRRNTIYGASYGVVDHSAQTGLAGLAFYVNNFVSGGDAFDVTNSPAARVIGNYVVNGTTGAVETTHV
jgi:hypothetical protein